MPITPTLPATRRRYCGGRPSPPSKPPNRGPCEAAAQYARALRFADGPHGQIAASDAGGCVVDTGRFVIVPLPHMNETLIGIKRPAGGRWTIAPQPGAPPIVVVSHANGLPSARITASVHGHRRVIARPRGPCDGDGGRPDGNPGPSRAARLAPTPPRPPDGCIRYLVTITVSGRNGARYVEMSSLTQLQPSIDLAKLKPGTEVHPMLPSQRSRQAGCEKNSADPMRRSTTSSV